MKNKPLFLAGTGFVYAVDRETGEPLWETELKKGWIQFGNEFVTLLESNDALFVFCYGTLFRLNRKTGEIQWRKEMSKLKYAVAMISDGTATSNLTTAAAGILPRGDEKPRDEEEDEDEDEDEDGDDKE